MFELTLVHEYMQINGDSQTGQQIFSPPLVQLSSSSPGPLSVSGSDDGSSIASSASAMIRAKPGPKGFKIPDLWRPSIMSVLNSFSDDDKTKKLTIELQNEIVRDLVIQMYACSEKPDKSFHTDVAKKLVSKYPFMRDKGGVSGCVLEVY